MVLRTCDKKENVSKNTTTALQGLSQRIKRAKASNIQQRLTLMLWKMFQNRMENPMSPYETNHLAE